MSKTINPKGVIEAFAPMLRPISQLDFGSSRGARKDVVRGENFQRGYAEGFEQGVEEGRQAGMAEFERSHSVLLEAFAAELQARADQIDVAFEAWCHSLENPLAEMAAAIAARIVARELQTDPAVILEITRAAIVDVTHATTARIRLNPFDSPTVRERAADLQMASASLRSVEVVDDPAILGGCVIETDGGSVDARVEAMIDQARKAIRGAS